MLDEQDNSTTRSDAIIPPPGSAIHPCTMGWIGTLLAETWWPSTLTSPRFAELTAKLDHLGWPVIQEQSITDLLFLVWKMSFRNFFRINLDPLNIIIHCHTFRVKMILRSLHLHWTFQLHFTQLQHTLWLTWTKLNHDFYLTEIFFLTQKIFLVFLKYIYRKSKKTEQPETDKNL